MKKTKVKKPVKKVVTKPEDKQFLTRANKITKMVFELDFEMGEFEKELKVKGWKAPPTQKEMVKEFLWVQFQELMEYLKSPRVVKQKFYREGAR